MKNCIILIVVLIISCSSMTTIHEEKSSGIEIAYLISYDEAWKLSKSILKEFSTGRSLIYDTENHHMSTPVNNGYIGVWIKEVGEKKVSIRVYSRRKLTTYILIGLSANKFHELLQYKIGRS